SQRTRLGDCERPLHAGGGVTGDGALVRVLAGLQEDDLERRRLPLVDQLAGVTGDTEVVPERALVRDRERDRALRDRRLRERELELGRLARDDGDRTARLPVVPRERGQRPGEGERGNREAEQAEPFSAHGEIPFCRVPLR